MSSMYKEAPWSLDGVLETVRGPSVSFAQAVDWLKDRTKEDDFSLADIWGILTAAGVMKEIDNRSLSHEAHREATNPYPIYSAIEKQSYMHGPTEGAWFELTPHECGFTELGLFIETSCLGSRFEGGEIVEERKEMDMVKLQGILGCALADEQYLGDMVIPDWMKADGLNATSTMGLYLQAYQILSKVVDLLKHSHEDHPSIATLEKLLEDNLKESKTHVPLDPETLKDISPEKHGQNFRNWGLNLTKSFETWCETLDESSFKSYLSWVTTHIFPLIVKWEWGTTNNFLHKYQDPAVPSSLQSNQHLYLIDGGLMINAPYPPVLGPKRDVDLIISLDSSAGDIFETLLLARDYSHKMKKPFPPINDSLTEEKEHPQDCYVFEGQPSDPTVMYMPLFNLQNCKDEEEIRKEKEEYATFQNPYSTKKMDHLLQKACVNIKNNKQKILKEIEKAVQRRQLKRKSKMPKMP